MLCHCDWHQSRLKGFGVNSVHDAGLIEEFCFDVGLVSSEAALKSGEFEVKLESV